MVTNFSSPIKGQNSGSSKAIINYLEKEDLGKKIEEKGFFDQKEMVSPYKAIEMIDNNGKNQGLKKEQDRFYCLTINPSEKELQHIGNDQNKLKSYTIACMENYAKNFNKDIDPNSLVWVAKIEKDRKYTYQDEKVEHGKRKRGDLKEGLQTHIHVVISRFTKKDNEMERTISISPLTNHKATDKGATKGGFNRVDFINANEKTFDESFKYDRKIEEKFDYSKASNFEKLEMVHKSKENALEQIFDPSFDVFEKIEEKINQEPKEEKQNEKKKGEDLIFDFGMF